MDNFYHYNNEETNQQLNHEVNEPNFILPQEPEPRNRESRKKKGGFKKWVSAGCAAILLGSMAGGAFVGVSYVGMQAIDTGSPVAEANKIETTAVLTNSATTITSDVSEIVTNTMPSIVSISSMTVQEVMDFFGRTELYEVPGAGSGIIIAEDEEELLILTNNHVVEGSTELTISFSNQESVQGEIKGTDAAKDLAIVAIDQSDLTSEMREGIKIATLGDSDALQVGEPLIAIGNALGYGQSVTTGVLSAIDRTLDGIDAQLLQTDAAINPGNSGGALMNAAGEVIGINTAKASDTAIEGTGYAIPISEASETIQTLMNQVTREVVPEAERGYIGIQGVSVTSETSEMYGMPAGVYVREIIEGGAAEAAGMVRGSVITELDGISVTDMDNLIEQLQYYSAGTAVTLTVEVPDAQGVYTEAKLQMTLQTAE